MAKIMQINITCGKGSTGSIAVRLYHAAEQAGFEARFAYASFKPTLPSAFRIENMLQHYYRRGMNKYFGKRQCHSTPGTKRLIRYIRREKPDLIHVHNVQQNSLNYILFFKFLQESGIPVVFTLHDCWSFTGGCYHFFKSRCEKYIQGLCGSCTEALDDISITAGAALANKQKWIGGNAQIHMVCVSQWLQTVAAKSYMGSMRHPPVVIYNGVDTQLFCPRVSDIRQQYNIGEHEYVILGVASYWNADKGIHYFEKLSQLMPEACKFILVGHGLEQSGEQYPRLICIPSTQSSQMLAELYSCADVFVNPSIMETFGLTTAEALACGTPAVVFQATACPEVLGQGTGICVAFQNDFEQDLKAIQEAILQIRKNGKNAYTKACVSHIGKFFSIENMTEAYLSLYRSILSESE